VKRSRQDRRIDLGSATTGLDERQAVKPLDLVFGTKPAVQVDQVGATAEQNVLAVVHYFARAWMFVGRSATSHERTTFEDRDIEPMVR
jgi:hypothetical protein